MNMKFSRRIVFVYTCIVVVPLLILVIYIATVTRYRQYSELRKQCATIQQENVSLINKNIETFELIERMINGNMELTLFFTTPETSNENEIINTMIDEATTIERTLSVLPNIYAVRIFTDNPIIPERWPVFMKSSRTNLKDLKRWEYNYSAKYQGNQEQMKQASLCTTRRIIKNRREIGYIQIAMKMQDFFPFLYKKTDEYQSDYVFTELHNPADGSETLTPVQNPDILEVQKILSAKDIKDLEYSVNYAGDRPSGTIVLKDGHDTRFGSWARIPDLGYIVMHVDSTSRIKSTIVLLEVGVIVGLLATVLVLFLLIRYTTGRLMSGVYSVMNGMKEVKEGNLCVTIPVDHHDEVGETQATFNAMTEQLRCQIEQIKQEQSLIADTEMKAMQNQINAHFLYNVLETIRMQAEIASEDDIAESITVLGKMMRYCLRWRIHVVTLEQEIEYIRSYVYILNVRNDYVISLETEIPDGYMTLEIPKMIMQPLIENAFTHAVEPLGKDAVIKVFAKVDAAGEILYLCVQDFGCGMNQEQLDKIRTYLADDTYERTTKGSIGLKNIQQRLTMYYGQKYRVQIESKEGEGTLVSVPVPLNKQIDQEK
jgi:two-component system sensor histidine kinase YesM